MDSELLAQSLKKILSRHYVSDVSGVAVPDLIKVVTQSNRALIERIRSELPESTYNKFEKCPYCGVPYQYQCTCDTGFDAAISQVTAVLAEIEESMK